MKEDRDLMQRLKPCAMDQILMYLAFSALKTGGHRHGAFLDAAATAAKCAIYSTYMEEEQNLRRTGRLHHLEPKRVKVIVKEIDQALAEGKLLKMLGSQEPEYLIQFPYVWLEQHPWQAGAPRIVGTHLTPREKSEIERDLPDELPPARLINSIQLMELIEFLHSRSQEALPLPKREPLSEPLLDHIRDRLIYSRTVERIDISRGLPLYVLLKTSYSPESREERVFSMIEDTASYFRLLNAWVDRAPHTFRALETLDVPADQVEEALNELDKLLRAWADKYHCEGSPTLLLQLAAGLK
ncbi:heterocyst differentiation control protein [Leptolyngbya sp. FACHB-261]|uniref:heterocyst differentiation control protein n=1 Tax=Leptolyngbya sp. FACHB-261 TaxID=2692806 RepID=UPI0016898BB2|nr:heterocyst differentiation control protein [Leptolyngbya sp. FACHB-261]MBD2099889.1 heterocyst differentiation control protein [Leptolyngbya sp. FACHB-261]